jgi:hypothetical protein
MKRTFMNLFSWVSLPDPGFQYSMTTNVADKERPRLIIQWTLLATQWFHCGNTKYSLPNKGSPVSDGKKTDLGSGVVADGCWMWGSSESGKNQLDAEAAVW